MRTRITIFLCLLLTLLAGCGGERKNDPVVATSETLTLALQQAVDNAVIPAVDGFREQANLFGDAADDFCTVTDENTLSALQARWHTLSEQWYRLAHYNFGPLNDDLVFPRYVFIDSLRLRGTDYTESVRSEITADMAGNHVLSDAYFNGKTFQNVGLLALEAAVFETASGEHSKTSVHIITEYKNNPRKCEMLDGLARHLIKQATYVQNGWKSVYINSSQPYRTLFLNNQLGDGSAPQTQLVVAVQEFLDYLKARSVATTAAQLSGHSWENLAAAIDEISSLLEGTEKTSVSFFSLMASAGYQNSVDNVRANIAEARQSIQDQNAALLEIALGKLDGNFKREIPNGLDVELGINFTDGD